jgi:hypothetical protein
MNGRKTQRTESTERDSDILWKRLTKSNYFLKAGRASREVRMNTGFFALSTVKPRTGMVAMREISAQFSRPQGCPKGKTRPGGQPDGSKPYGRLGWMGARA